ncbi:type I methionyl aminopeptidase [Candidatus Atelocyanobacterium thalassae]|uniref:Methionine aminopeptidase n=1 Tax=cyanobacterium endosymbiont of Braarudosphaera bigelowii TaxID=1285375 RepID=A0ABM7U3F5_9CHRO|nr:type I methionyl aminopeptidase [Candidatus Atelocyanobacterium thalassa]BDA39222.1 methionine aminopeptidase 1 [cyanobacterium endosymbiont of Braarudosphaera bigelowii]
MQIKSDKEIKIMRHSSYIVSKILDEIEGIIKPGVTTKDIDNYAEYRIKEMNAEPSFKGYCGYLHSICISINNEVSHGIPTYQRIIMFGDIVKVDIGVYYQGFHGDSCITIPINKVSLEASRLIKATKEALYAGIKKVKEGHYLSDIAIAIEKVIHKYDYTIVEEYTGHGIGYNLHEEPIIFNSLSNQNFDIKLKAGMIFTIEPIVNQKSKYTKILSDGWTVVTIDHGLSAQFEHTVLVTHKGYEILTNKN